MLVEIRCDKFQSQGKPREPIAFKPGLNTILGGTQANNSIGKTTLLLIIDFVFGGRTYLQSEAVRQVGPHDIQFCFEFSGARYHFSRNTTTGMVSECDQDYRALRTHDVGWLHDFLFEHYEININELSFRGLVGRYFRIYGKDNCNEKKPLSEFSQQKSIDAVMDLLRIFDRYSFVKEYQDAANLAEEKLKAYKLSQKHGFTPATIKTKTKYLQNQKLIEELEKKMRLLQQQEEMSLFDLEWNNADQASKTKAEISSLKRKRTKMLSQLRIVEANMNKTLSPLGADFTSLLEFFPEADVNKLENIEAFHAGILEILSFEFSQEHDRLQSVVLSIEEELKQLQQNLVSLGVPIYVPKRFLDKYIGLKTEMDILVAQNAGYKNTEKLKNDKRDSANLFQEVFDRELRWVESEINVMMLRLNDYIYSNSRKAPVLDLKDGKTYTFETPDDTGTGTSYKSLIIFDLSILALTRLPALAHDSLLFKNIADEPVDKIMQLYAESEKQIFIAFDKDTAYPETTQQILQESTVIHLDEGGNELFGYSWSKKEA